MNKDVYKSFFNITNVEVIKDSLNFYALYLLLFENFKNMIVFNVKNFLCDISFKDGKIIYIKSLEYKKIENKKYKGKKNVFINTLDWLKNLDAISEKEFNKILEIRDDRNKIGHELLDLLLNDFEVDMIENFIELINICKKIDKWWINNIEIPIAGDDVAPGYDENGVMSGNWLLCEMIIDTIYGNKIYKDIVEKIINDYN